MSGSEAAYHDDFITAEIERIRFDAADYRRPTSEYVAKWDRAPFEAEQHWQARQRNIPIKVRREILLGDCTYCGDEATCIDHVLPVSRGGTRDRDNLAPACEPCNMDKLNFTPEEWRDYCLERDRPWPPVPRGVAVFNIIASVLARMSPEDRAEIEAAG